MKHEKIPQTFREFLRGEFKRFGLRKKHEELYLRLQEKKLIVDKFEVDYGPVGKLKFAEAYSHDSVWEDLKTLSVLQGLSRATLIPGIGNDGNVNPIFFLPDTPKNLVTNARNLEKTLLRKKVIEGGIGRKEAR